VATLAIPAEALLIVGSALAKPGFVHERHVTVQFDDRSDPGLLLDGDTAFCEARNTERARRVCRGNHCIAVLTSEPCGFGSCPVPGKRLILERPIAEIVAWPGARAEEVNLCIELERDDALRPLIASCLPRRLAVTWGYTDGPPPEPLHFHWEISGAVASIAPQREHVVFGGELSLGASYSYHYSGPSDWAFGNVWGASMRAGAYGSSASRIAITLSFDNFNIVGSFEDSHVRVPALMGVVIPEVGVFVRDGTPVAPLLRWHLPFGILLTRALAVDARPTFAIAYPTSGAPPEWMLGLAVGALLRLP
jgi:hypothetical protein